MQHTLVAGYSQMSGPCSWIQAAGHGVAVCSFPWSHPHSALRQVPVKSGAHNKTCSWFICASTTCQCCAIVTFWSRLLWNKFCSQNWTLVQWSSGKIGHKKNMEDFTEHWTYMYISLHCGVWMTDCNINLERTDKESCPAADSYNIGAEHKKWTV